MTEDAQLFRKTLDRVTEYTESMSLFRGVMSLIALSVFAFAILIWPGPIYAFTFVALIGSIYSIWKFEKLEKYRSYTVAIGVFFILWYITFVSEKPLAIGILVATIAAMFLWNTQWMPWIPQRKIIAVLLVTTAVFWRPATIHLQDGVCGVISSKVDNSQEYVFKFQPDNGKKISLEVPIISPWANHWDRQTIWDKLQDGSHVKVKYHGMSAPMFKVYRKVPWVLEDPTPEDCS